MNKGFKKFIASMLVIGVISTSVSAPAFANYNEDENLSSTEVIQQSDVGEIQPYLVTSPARYEYTTRIKALNKDGLWNLFLQADKVDKSGTAANYVSLSSFMLSLAGSAFSSTSTALGAISYMMQRDLNVTGTMSYAMTKYRYLDTHPSVTTVSTKLYYKRFFDGITMKPWYPWSAPTTP